MKEDLKLNNEARALIFGDHILMSELCDLLELSPNDIKYNGHQGRLLEKSALNIITKHTGLTVEQLTN